MIGVLETAVRTIVDVLTGRLPAPSRNQLQQGHGGWVYKVVKVGGDTPPSGEANTLWWFQWGKCVVHRGWPNEEKELVGTYTSVNEPEEQLYHLFVAPALGIVHWWLTDTEATITGSRKVRGELPLVFAVPETPRELLRAQVGIALCRQARGNPKWVQEFQKWLLSWVADRVGEENRAEVTFRLMNAYTPGSAFGLLKYLQKAKKRGKSSWIAEMAKGFGISPSTLYYHLQKEGALEENRKYSHGSVTFLCTQRLYLPPQELEEVVAGITEKIQYNKARKEIVKLIARKRGTGIRAAQRLVKRRLEQGKSLREIWEEFKGAT